MATLFERVDLTCLPLASSKAHGGEGQIQFCRVVNEHDVEGHLNFIDVAVLPPHTSVGRHTHGEDEEEFYVILEGTGQMIQNGTAFAVHEGMLVRNPPGGTHELRNDGPNALRMLVFEVAV